MLLQARMLDGVCSVNTFDYADAAVFTEGDQVDVYFQLIDANQDRPGQGFRPAGRRYMPAALSTLQVTIDNIDDAVKIVRAASQPFPLDPSIWKVTVLSTDTIRGTCALSLKLVEPSKTSYGRTEAVILIHNQGAL